MVLFPFDVFDVYDSIMQSFFSFFFSCGVQGKLDFKFFSSVQSCVRDDVLHISSNKLHGILFLVEGFSSAGILIAVERYL